MSARKQLKNAPRKFPFDYLAIIATLVAANLLVGELAEQNIRQRTFENATVKLARNDIPDNFSLVILGDSRSGLINERLLAKKMGIGPELSINLSTNSGGWVSSFSLLKQAKPILSDDAHVLLCLSEYWLERPSLQDRSGFLSSFSAYWGLGQYRDAFTSVLPLSAKRGQMVNRIRALTESPFLNVSNTTSNSEDTFEGMEKSNIDLWFSEIEEEQVTENFDFADHALEQISEMGPHLVLVYLPNAITRESYVEKSFPGRRSRFIGNITRLARKHDLSFIDMSSEPELNDNDLYADFHHWNKMGAMKGTKALADLLRVRPDR